MDNLCNKKSSAIDMLHGFLNLTEQYLVSRERKCHGTNLAQELVPIIYDNMILSVGYGRDDLPEAPLSIDVQ